SIPPPRRKRVNHNPADLGILFMGPDPSSGLYYAGHMRGEAEFAAKEHMGSSFLVADGSGSISGAAKNRWLSCYRAATRGVVRNALSSVFAGYSPSFSACSSDPR